MYDHRRPYRVQMLARLTGPRKDRPQERENRHERGDPFQPGRHDRPLRLREVLPPVLIWLLICLGVLLLVSLSGCASVRPEHPGHAGFIVSAAGDVYSTERALSAGASERNPLLGEDPSTAKLVGFKLAAWAGLRTVEEALEDELGRDLRWWEQALLWVVPAGLQTWATFHNLGAARQLEQER